MTIKSLSITTTQVEVPADTIENSFQFLITGILADGTTPFSQTVISPGSSTSADLPDGTFTVSVSKNGFSSLPSDVFTVTAIPPVDGSGNSGSGGTLPVTTIKLTVPDSTAKPTVA
jgi:hypothetical protein